METGDESLINNFYELFNNFGYIEYKVGNKTYRQDAGFNELKSAKISEDNTYYIEIKKEIAQASSICLGLKVRNVDYRYYLK